MISWDDQHVLVDCGDGTVHQLQRAGFDLSQVTRLIFTHLHWDHILGYPSLVWGTWAAGRTELEVWGPSGTQEMHDRLVGSYYSDQAAFAQALGYDSAGWDDITVREVSEGTTLDLAGCDVRFAHVVHPPIEAFGIRFEHRGRSIAISGDSTFCQELVTLATDADLFVADTCAVQLPNADNPQRRRVMARLGSIHASPRQAAEMAAQAGVGKLVCTHLLPGVEPEMVRSDCAGAFEGPVEVGVDLETYEAQPTTRSL